MRSKNLEAFYWVTRLGSFTAAAEKLCTTQPGISARIKDLEENFGQQLFDRSSGKIQLTPAGQICWKYAENIISLMDEMYSSLADENSYREHIRFGVMDTILHAWFPMFQKQIHQIYPNTCFELILDLSVNLQKRLERHELDLCILCEGAPYPGIENILLHPRPLVWVAHKNFPIDSENLSAEKLTEVPILSYTKGSHFYDLIISWFRNQQVTPKTIHTLNSHAAMIHLVLNELGIAAVPLPSVYEELRKKKLKLLTTNEPLPEANLAIAYVKKTHCALTTKMVEIMLQIDESWIENNKIFLASNN